MNRIIQKINMPSFFFDNILYFKVICKKLKPRKFSTCSNVKYFLKDLIQSFFISLLSLSLFFIFKLEFNY